MRQIFGLLILVIIVAGAFMWRQHNTMHHPIAVGEGEPIAQVSVPALTAAAKMGETAFDENCSVCHGENAAGQQGVAPPLIHKIYEPSHHGDQSFVLAVKRGVRAHHWPFGNMPPVPGVTDQQISTIIAYVRELQRAIGIN